MNLLTRHPKIVKILKIVSLIAIVVFELGFLYVAAIDFSKGADGPGAVGLFFSILLLGAAIRILGGPKKIGPLVQRVVVGGGPPIHGRGLKVRYYVGVGFFAFVLLLFVGIGGPVQGPAVDVVVAAYFLGFPLLTWRFLPERIARFVIDHFFRGKLYYRILSAVLRKKREPSRLFFTAQSGHQIVLLRFAQVVIFT